jgi:hypothetical protein
VEIKWERERGAVGILCDQKFRGFGVVKSNFVQILGILIIVVDFKSLSRTNIAFWFDSWIKIHIDYFVHAGKMLFIYVRLVIYIISLIKVLNILDYMLIWFDFLSK